MTVPSFVSALFNHELWNEFGWQMLAGAGTTAKLVAVSFGLGLLLGMLLALARLSGRKTLVKPAEIFIYFFRGSPLLAQLFLVYYGLGSLFWFWKSVGLWWFFRDAWYCTLLAFTLNTAAYQAEIFRGSLLTVSKNQYEAAQALGLGRSVTFFKIILPQLLVSAIGPLGNELIMMIKSSAIASLVTIYDIMGVAKLAFSRSFDFTVFIWAAIFYLIIVEIVRRLHQRLDFRLKRHLG